MDTTSIAKVVQVSSSVNLVLRYRWAISNVDMNIAKKL